LIFTLIESQPNILAVFTKYEGIMDTTARLNRHFLTCIYAPEEQTLGKHRVTLRENHDWKTEAKGETADYHSLASSVNRFLGTAEGLFRVGQLGERVPKFVNTLREDMGMSRVVPLDACMANSVSAWTWLTAIPRAIEMTPGVIRDVKDAKDALHNKDLTSPQVRYKLEKATREVTDAVAMYAYSMSNITGLFPSMTPFTASTMNFADSATFAHDVVSLKMNVENLVRMRSLDTSKATPAMKETIEQTKTYNMWAIAKDVVASVSGFFKLFLAAVAVPKIAFATLSLASTVFAVIRKMYEETMVYKPVTFLDAKQVSLVTV
jgi:hypothetical protein